MSTKSGAVEDVAYPQHPSAAWQFPELEQFELEMELADGSWTTIRRNEHELAAYVMSEAILLRNMLCGPLVTVEHGAELKAGILVKPPQRTRFRLTPKSWLGREHAREV
jgi:hypothetical protein